MTEFTSDEPFDGVIVNEKARFIALIKGLFNEIEEQQREEAGMEELTENDSMEASAVDAEQFSSQGSKGNVGGAKQNKEKVNEDALDYNYQEDAGYATHLPEHENDTLQGIASQMPDSQFDSYKYDEWPSQFIRHGTYFEDNSAQFNQDPTNVFHSNEMGAGQHSTYGSGTLSNYSMSEDHVRSTSLSFQTTHDQFQTLSGYQPQCELTSTAHNLQQKVKEVKEKLSMVNAKLDEMEKKKQEKISLFSQLLEGNYRTTFENLNQNITVVLENARYAEDRLRKADEKYHTFHRNLQQRQHEFDVMNLQLSLSLVDAEKFNLLKIHGGLQLDRREAVLDAQVNAQEREFEGARKERQAINDELGSEHEIALAKKRLLVEDLPSNEKEALLERVKGDKEFEDIYLEQIEKEQKSSEMADIILSQNRHIEDLNSEISTADEEIRKERKIGKWKRRMLALFCIRIEDDDNDT